MRLEAIGCMLPRHSERISYPFGFAGTSGYEEIRLIVYGLPGPQGSKRHVGQGRMIESSRKVQPWRAAVAAEAKALLGSGWTPWDEPLRMRLVVSLARPKRPKFATVPAVPPDLSKLARSTEDALTGVLWRDDSRVWEFERLAKVYVGGDPEAIDRPGALIVVRKGA